MDVDTKVTPIDVGDMDPLDVSIILWDKIKGLSDEHLVEMIEYGHNGKVGICESLFDKHYKYGCPLCDAYVDDECSRCPIYIETGYPYGCERNNECPYSDFRDAMFNIDTIGGRNATNGRNAAKRFHEYLVNLRKKYSCPVCGSMLELSECMDVRDSIWISCPNYPYCPTRLPVKKEDL